MSAENSLNGCVVSPQRLTRGFALPSVGYPVRPFPSTPRKEWVCFRTGGITHRSHPLPRDGSVPVIPPNDLRSSGFICG